MRKQLSMKRIYIMFINYLNDKLGEGIPQAKIKILQSEIKDFLDYMWKNKEKDL